MVDSVSVGEALALLGEGIVIGAVAAAGGALVALGVVGGLAFLVGVLNRAYARRR